MLPKRYSEVRIGAMRWQLPRGQQTSDDPSPQVEVDLEPRGAVQRVALVATTQRLGGVRWWFSCPGCERRCAVLYRPPRRQRYACRICTGVDYDTQKASR